MLGVASGKLTVLGTALFIENIGIAATHAVQQSNQPWSDLQKPAILSFTKSFWL